MSDMPIARARTALVVVDMQTAFCDPSGSLARLGFPVAPLADAVAPCVRAVGLARAAGVPVIFTRYVWRADYADGGLLANVLMPHLKAEGALVDGSADAAIVPALTPLPGETVIDKNRPSGFFRTRLDEVATAHGLEQMVLCGVTTNCCVESTARDASHRDILPVVLSDATAEMDAARHDGALAAIAMLFGRVATLDELARAWVRTGS